MSDGKVVKHRRKAISSILTNQERVFSVFIYLNNKVFKSSLLEVNIDSIFPGFKFLRSFVSTTFNFFLISLDDFLVFLLIVLRFCRFVSRSIPKHRLPTKQGVNINNHKSIYSSTTSSERRSFWVGPMLM